MLVQLRGCSLHCAFPDAGRALTSAHSLNRDAQKRKSRRACMAFTLESMLVKGGLSARNTGEVQWPATETGTFMLLYYVVIRFVKLSEKTCYEYCERTRLTY